MNDLAQVAALVGAIFYIGASPLELFFYGRPWARRFLHVETQNLDDVRMWAAMVGFRNLLVGIGTLVGLCIYRNGDATYGEAVVVAALWYQLLASLAMGVADLAGLWRPRGGSVIGTIASSSPAAVALLAIWLG